MTTPEPAPPTTPRRAWALPAALVAAGALLGLAVAGGIYAATRGDDGESVIGATPTPTSTPSASATTASPTTSTASLPTATPTPTSATSATPATPTPSPLGPTPRAIAPDDRVQLAGVGPLRIGMTYDQMRAAVTHQVRIGEGPGPGPACVYPTLVGLPDDEQLAMLGGDGTLRSITVYDRGRMTQSGLQVGDPESRVRAIYGGDAQLLPADPSFGRYNDFYVVAPGDSLELAIEVDDTREVIRYAVGEPSWTKRFEGCA